MIELDKTPRLNLSQVKQMIDSAEQSGEQTATTFSAEDYGVSYHLVYNPSFGCLTIEWNDEGARREENIYIISKDSNLNNGSKVRYFLCPYSGHKCRRLFLLTNAIASRSAFAHTYSKRNQPKNWRVIGKFMDASDFLTDEVTRNRKVYYNGKLTPFGKKYIKALNTTEQIGVVTDLPE